MAPVPITPVGVGGGWDQGLQCVLLLLHFPWGNPGSAPEKYEVILLFEVNMRLGIGSLLSKVNWSDL